MAILSIYYYIICADKSKEKSQIGSKKLPDEIPRAEGKEPLGGLRKETY